jgi:hypothetical protein
MNNEVMFKDETWSEIKLISGHGNIGFAAACNLGARSASCPILLFLNPDCVIQPDSNSLSHMAQALIDEKDAMMAGCRIINSDGSDQVTCRRNIMTPSNAISESLKLYKLSKQFPILNNYPIQKYVPAISGCCMMLRAADFQQLGGFDEAYFLHVEDMDLCLRISQLGKKILYINDIVIKHLLSTSDESSLVVEKYKSQGFLYYFNKYYPNNLLWLMKLLIKAKLYQTLFLNMTSLLVARLR